MVENDKNRTDTSAKIYREWGIAEKKFYVSCMERAARLTIDTENVHSPS